MERTIGEVFEYTKKKGKVISLQVLNVSHDRQCEGCYFLQKNCDKTRVHEQIGDCYNRTDENYIYFALAEEIEDYKVAYNKLKKDTQDLKEELKFLYQSIM